MKIPFQRSKSPRVHDVVIVNGKVCEIVKIRTENRTLWCVVDNHDGFTRSVPAYCIGR
jgi:hypothetical protein